MSTIPKLSIIFAGEELSATLLDGKTTAVRVRAMPVRHLARILQLADNEAELIDFVCQIPAEPADQAELPGWERVPAGWSDNLTDESHVALYEAAKRQNFTRATNWAERQIEAKKLNNQIMLKTQEALLPLLKQIAGSLGLSSDTPTAAGNRPPKSLTPSPGAS